MSDADLVTGLRSLNRCIRCDCNACISGQENHEHICSGDKGCVAPLEPQLRKAIILGRSASDRIEALAAEVERLRDDIRQLWNFGIDELRICEHCDAWLTTEEAARVEDVALCPREAFGSAKFPNEKCFQHRAWIVKEDKESARDFITAQEKEKGK